MDVSPESQAVIAFNLPDDPGGTLLFLPVFAAAISASVLLLHSVLAFKSVTDQLTRFGILKERREKVAPPGIGKGAILCFRIARLLGCVALFGLSIFPLVEEESGATLREGLGRELLLSAPYLYASALALLSVSPKNTRHRLIRHVNILLFLSFGVYAYRDLFPLATFTSAPADLGEGRRLWAKIALLSITAVIIPVFTPRQYIPVDPLNPMKVPNPEQTASIFSFTFYFFLDQIIFLAYRQKEVREDQLYPLCDTDASVYLKTRSFKYLDKFSGNKSRGHLFLGLMRVFGREYTILTGILILRVLTNFSGPFAMKHLLQYIERQEEGAEVRPWVWIAMIFLGPLFGTLLWQVYVFINTRSLVRAEAIITQLVFAHSLRIRMKAETAAMKDTSDTPAVESPPFAPAAGSSSGSTGGSVTPQNGRSASCSDDGSATVQASTSSIKPAASKPPSKPAKKDAKAKKSEGSLIGKINNLVTVDLGNIVESRDFLMLFVSIPGQLGVGIWFLYTVLGWSVLVGVASIILLVPVPGYMAKLVQSVQKERLKRTDNRIQSVTEAVNVLRMIKLFGWEEKMKARIGDKRDYELTWIRKRRLLDLASGLVKYVVTMTTLVMGKPLNASKVFSSMTISYRLNNVMTGKVSLDRVNNFLNTTELLDAFDETEVPALFPADTLTDERIGFRNTTFSWSKESGGALTHSQRHFLLKIEGELLFRTGQINLIVGPTGSGEMHWIPSSPDSWFNLPRGFGVAYAAQESWVLNETIRTNIIFNTPFDNERYKKVLYQCALEPDLDLFQAGDQTEVGEKGLTLSGGQKARLTLARAVYSKAGILLLDDVFAALEKSFVIDKKSENRTVILVTHNVALTRPIADFVVTFGSDGRVHGQDSIPELTKGDFLTEQIRKDVKIQDKAQQETDLKTPATKPGDGKLIVAEEIQLGHIGGSALKMYLSAMAGNYAAFYFVFFFGSLCLQQYSVVLKTWMLGYWAKQYDNHSAESVNVVFFLSLFVGIVLFSIVVFAAAFTSLVWGQLRASKVIHASLIGSVLTAPLRWLDTTPTSRILARVTNDVKAVDDSIGSQIWILSSMFISMGMKLGAVIIYTPIFFFPGVLVGSLGAWVGQVYIAGQLPVKRLMSNNRAPVLAHFGAAIAGLVSIRAFGAQAKFSSESLARIDIYTRAARNYYNLNRWVSVRIDILGAAFSAGLAAYLVYFKHTSAGDSGFLLNMAITFTQMLLGAVTLIPFSLERIQGYLDIEHEKPATEAGTPPAYWPGSGDLQVERLSARYSEEGPKVLDDISFHVKSGERVGIVGRTGSGKSSLTLSLLQCIPTHGSVTYDGLETSKLNLDALRSSITIIPQVPELLSGSLRVNLDPFGQYDDVELNYALRAAGLFALQNETDENRITLDTAISVGGSNLSIGQRQIFALARAIVRKSKILILDEGNLTLTSILCLDYKTDCIIQNSLRHELRGDVSLITVAHRLQTVMDMDKIMVLDAGRIVEFDSPKELLKIKNGRLRALVDESGDRETLYAMAGAH
ncbi:P-loop containing nucleoside triphosphate hydrolase protein [Mycena capillaripes]|nr:P-loop containing nucleoside triphosphate hydrolase protein [Mycena capillaripes]